MPRLDTNRLESHIVKWDALTDPKTRYCDLAIQFKVEDGDKAGKLSTIHGGTWDRDANNCMGRFINHYDQESGLFLPNIHGEKVYKLDVEPFISPCSAQSIPIVADYWTRTILAVGGRRSGKSFAAAQRAIVMAIRFPGRKGMVLSPTYRQAKNVYNHIYNIIPRNWLFPGKLGYKWGQEYKEFRFINGSIICFRSADNPDSARSDGVAWLLADEMQDIGSEAYSNAHLSMSEGGDDYLVVQTATIKPDFREHYDRLVEKEESSIGLAKVIRMVSRNNPFIGHAMFDEAAEFLDAEMVRRELEAQWPELVGRIYYTFRYEHIRRFPDVGREDETAVYLYEKFGGKLHPYQPGAPNWFISVDPPGFAVLWKIYADGTMHAVHEVLIGADGQGGDVRTLAKRCKQICGQGIVVPDPHDKRWHHDIVKYFKAEGFRLVYLKRVNPEYRITAVRAQQEKGKLLIDPRCVHLKEVFERHCYKDDGSGEADKKECYQKPHERNSKLIQLVHLADAMGYGVYKLNPAKYDYVKNERKAA